MSTPSNTGHSPPTLAGITMARLDGELKAAHQRIAELEAELAKLSNPVAVHVNMLRGTIATPSRELMEHVWGTPPPPTLTGESPSPPER